MKNSFAPIDARQLARVSTFKLCMSLNFLKNQPSKVSGTIELSFPSTTTEGQIILKCLFGVFNFLQKKPKTSQP